MSKYLSDQIQKKFQSLRKEAREKLYISFNHAYVLCLGFIIILGALYVWVLNSNANSGYQMTRIESIRREKQTQKHFLRTQIANQESLKALKEATDSVMVTTKQSNIIYISSEKIAPTPAQGPTPIISQEAIILPQSPKQ